LTDSFLIGCSLPLAFLLRVGPDIDPRFLSQIAFYLPAILAIRLICLFSFRCYTVMWRYISIVDAWRLTQAVFLSSGIIIAFSFFLPPEVQRLPRSIYVIEALTCLLILMAVRLARRMRYEAESSKLTVSGKRTLILGAGTNGRLIAHRFKSDASLETHVVGFLDDDPRKANLIIGGIPVIGDRRILQQLIDKHRVTQVIVAVPNIKSHVLREIVAATRPFNIRPRLTTRLGAATEDKSKNLEIIREVELSDLLNRPRREVDYGLVRSMIQGRRVLVTGAGGSIGSELARQIMQCDPARLVLLDHSEYNLYEIDKELRLSTHDTQRVVPLLADLKDYASLRSSMLEYKPELVFHAAAYKHVHLVEANPFTSISNNVGGTHNLLQLCLEVGVDTFLMISTDKAVNPAGVMGASKRVCELLVTAMALETGKQYCSTRFGNVLGSSGSIIPLLRQQIQNGGPVTITHPEVTRFFMLIPEAVSLVLTASTVAKPGDVSVLKMGDPVKILEIARSMISLMDRSEDDIPIVFTGLRPGEKMHEELYLRGDEVQTEHPDILTLRNGDSSLTNDRTEIARLRDIVDQMLALARDSSREALFKLSEIVSSNYVPPKDELKDQGAIAFYSPSSVRH
jgi:FlaA1/EpsC-like NDP-sugar epimerase